MRFEMLIDLDHKSMKSIYKSASAEEDRYLTLKVPLIIMSDGQKKVSETSLGIFACHLGGIQFWFDRPILFVSHKHSCLKVIFGLILFTSFICSHVQETDTEYNIDSWSEKMKEMLGFTSVEAMQMNLFRDLISENQYQYPPFDIQSIEDKIDHRLKLGLEGKEILDMRIKEGEIGNRCLGIYVEYCNRTGLGGRIDGYSFKSSSFILRKAAFKHRDRAKRIGQMIDSLTSSCGDKKPAARR